jgi:RNA polymerase sigma-70 factor (ECF subfamily)
MAHRPPDPEIPDIYRQTIGPLYAYVSRRCGGERALAEDVVQETWLRAVEAWRKQGLPDAPAAWLTTVARHLLVSHFRRRRLLALSDAAADSILAAVDDGLATESGEAATMIQCALARLPRRQAALLEAFHLEQRPVGQIAGELGLSERAVEGRLRRGRLKLRALIEKAIVKKKG